MVRLFVAIELPEAVRAALASLCHGVPGARWITPENMHLTLRFIGEVDGGLALDIAAALDEIEAPRFEIGLLGVGHYGSGTRARVLWAGTERTAALQFLHDKVELALVRTGIAPEDRKFSSHITLARLNGAPSERVAGFIASHNMFRCGPIAVDKFTLFSSRLGNGAAVYHAEAEYPLR